MRDGGNISYVAFQLFYGCVLEYGNFLEAYFEFWRVGVGFQQLFIIGMTVEIQQEL